MPVETSQPDDQAWQFSYFAAVWVLPGRPSDAKLHERHASPELGTTAPDIARAPSQCFISVQETFHLHSSYTLHKKLGTGGAAGVLSLVSFPPTSRTTMEDRPTRALTRGGFAAFSRASGTKATSSLVNCVDCAHSTIPDHRQGSPEEFLPSAPKGPLLNHPAPSHNWVRQIRYVRRVSPPCVFLVQSLVNVLFMCSLVRSHRPACLCLTAGPPYRRRP